MILALTSFAGFGLASLSVPCTLIPGSQRTSNTYYIWKEVKEGGKYNFLLFDDKSLNFQDTTSRLMFPKMEHKSCQHITLMVFVIHSDKFLLEWYELLLNKGGTCPQWNRLGVNSLVRCLAYMGNPKTWG